MEPPEIEPSRVRGRLRPPVPETHGQTTNGPRRSPYHGMPDSGKNPRCIAPSARGGRVTPWSIGVGQSSPHFGYRRHRREPARIPVQVEFGQVGSSAAQGGDASNELNHGNVRRVDLLAFARSRRQGARRHDLSLTILRAPGTEVTGQSAAGRCALRAGSGVQRVANRPIAPLSCATRVPSRARLAGSAFFTRPKRVRNGFPARSSARG
jgi:hypothetical protein